MVPPYPVVVIYFIVLVFCIYFKLKMGNENEKSNQNGELVVSINHPRFQNARLVSEGKEKLLQLTMGVDER